VVLAYSARELVSVIGTGVKSNNTTFSIDQGPTGTCVSIFTCFSS